MSYCHDSYRDNRSIKVRTFWKVLMKSFDRLRMTRKVEKSEVVFKSVIFS